MAGFHLDGHVGARRARHVGARQRLGARLGQMVPGRAVQALVHAHLHALVVGRVELDGVEPAALAVEGPAGAAGSRWRSARAGRPRRCRRRRRRP